MTRIFLFSPINFVNITNILIFRPQIAQIFSLHSRFFGLATERTHEPRVPTHKKTHTLYIRYVLFVFSRYINSNKSHNAMV